ncbi:MAG: hypothetical protein ACLQGP_08190 [Isosphaeraceae bacterium]
MAIIDRQKVGGGDSYFFTTNGNTYKDDGVSDPNPIGMILVTPSTLTLENGDQQNINGQEGWTLNTFDSATTTVVDPSTVNAPNTYNSLSVDDLYTTYLMYQPPGGVWIALQQLTWSFVGSATGPAPNWPTDQYNTQVPSQSTAPGGGNEFSAWTGLVSGVTWRQND